MELGSHIKEHRKELRLSQDDLAERIYVSRQTISNWECGRTYPDVQSLLLLSNVFGVTVDSLIKGDVETMAQVMDEATKSFRQAAAVLCGSIIACILLATWAAFQRVWNWGDHMAPTLVFLLLATIIMCCSAWRIERIKKDNDLATYKEILAFSRGEYVDRETPQGHRERAMEPWKKGVRGALKILLGAAAGGIAGVSVLMLIKMLA